MSSVVNNMLQSGESLTPPALQDLYAPIADELAQAEQILRDEMRSEYAYVDEIVRYGVLLGGKRLRPALVLLAGKAAGRTTREHLVLAAVVEMIHTATLVHDDVLDDAETRRHLATVNSRWDSKTSVLLGDFLFTHAFYLASTLETTWACRVIGRATNTVCEGEMRQQGSMGDYTLEEAEYVDMISAKTAELCACACELGAYYASSSPDVVTRLSQFGRNLGIAFQIADDILDLAGDEKTTGKSLGTDLAQQKPTLPLLHLLATCSRAERAEVLAVLHGAPEQRLSALRPYFRRYDCLKYARDRALEFSQRAAEQLDILPASPARNTLAAMAHFAVARSR
ncbi:MAG: polyprenyl synthetase family protein [Pirellulaceae bacterium]